MKHSTETVIWRFLLPQDICLCHGLSQYGTRFELASAQQNFQRVSQNLTCSLLFCWNHAIIMMFHANISVLLMSTGSWLVHGASFIPHNDECVVTYSSSGISCSWEWRLRRRRRRRRRNQTTTTIMMTMISGMMTAGTATAAIGVPASTASVTVSVATWVVRAVTTSQQRQTSII